MNLLLRALHLAYENRASVTATSALVFTAFLYESPVPGTKFGFKEAYTWVRSSLMLLSNMRHPQPPAAEVADALPKL